MSAITEITEKPIGVHFDHAACLLCGTDNPWSLGLTFESDSAGGVSTTVEADARLQGYAGMLHGGVSAALLDAAMTHCLFHRGVRAVTADLRVRYVKSVPIRQGVTLKAWVTEEMPPLYRLKAQILLEGIVLVWAKATFCKLSANGTLDMACS